MLIRPQNPSVVAILFSVKGTILVTIWPKLLFTVLLSSLVVATERSFHLFHFNLTAVPFTLWGLTLAIALGFRNTVAYQRFWEARTLWGELLVVSRSLARQSLSFLPEQDDAERRRFSRTLIAFSYALRDHLRSTPRSEDTIRLLAEGEADAALAPAGNLPGALLGLLGRRVARQMREAGAGDILLAQMDQQLSRLSYVLGGCERIRNTPIPYPYILMLHRIVHFYCFALPFCLVDSIGWFTPLAVGMLAYTFFGLDALGDQIADPFDTQPNDLPLDAMSRNVEIAVLELLGEPAPAPLQPVDGMLL
jgi:putative membrane protein